MCVSPCRGSLAIEIWGQSCYSSGRDTDLHLYKIYQFGNDVMDVYGLLMLIKQLKSNVVIDYLEYFLHLHYYYYYYYYSFYLLCNA